MYSLLSIFKDLGLILNLEINIKTKMFFKEGVGGENNSLKVCDRGSMSPSLLVYDQQNRGVREMVFSREEPPIRYIIPCGNVLRSFAYKR